MESILIIGNGGREYSIAFELRHDERVENIFFAPQHKVATLILGAKYLEYKNNNELLKLILENNISLVVIGPEAYIINGLSDFLRSKNIKVFAPSLFNSKLEGSKSFMKQFIKNLNIPTAKYQEINLNNIEKGFKLIDSIEGKIVLKADGLCGGKGVLILDSKYEAKVKLQNMLEGNLFGDAGKTVLIEEFLDGYELSIFALSNGDKFFILPACQDHKRLFDSDKGPNTGGMGAYTKLPNSLYNEELESKISNRILKPTIEHLKNIKEPYTGVLFAGIMVVQNEPYLLEYNVRFGDPECEILMPLFKTKILDILKSIANFEMPLIELYDHALVCIVLSSSDYAQDDKSSDYPALVSIKEYDSNLGHLIFANSDVKDGKIYANTGRAIIAVGKGRNLEEARTNAYSIVEHVSFKGMHYRKDIAYQAFKTS